MCHRKKIDYDLGQSGSADSGDQKTNRQQKNFQPHSWKFFLSTGDGSTARPHSLDLIAQTEAISKCLRITLENDTGKNERICKHRNFLNSRSPLQGYVATEAALETKTQIYSAMVVYGLLTYKDGAVFIPNKELMDKYNELLLTNDSLGYAQRLAKASFIPPLNT